MYDTAASAANDIALPPDTGCDRCNQYCGHELDTAVVKKSVDCTGYPVPRPIRKERNA